MRNVTRICFALAIIAIAGVAPVRGATGESTEAGQAYIAGLRAWNAGQVDEAIKDWEYVLTLNPKSTVTKDRLLAALKKKIESLQRQITEIRASPAKPEEPKNLKIEITGPPPPVSPSRATAVYNRDLKLRAYDVGWLREGGRSRYIVGKITNEANVRYRSVLVEFTLLEASGSVIGKAGCVGWDLAPGESWKFKAHVTDPEVQSYKILPIRVMMDTRGKSLQ